MRILNFNPVKRIVSIARRSVGRIFNRWADSRLIDETSRKRRRVNALSVQDPSKQRTWNNDRNASRAEGDQTVRGAGIGECHIEITTQQFFTGRRPLPSTNEAIFGQ